MMSYFFPFSTRFPIWLCLLLVCGLLASDCCAASGDSSDSGGFAESAAPVILSLSLSGSNCASELYAADNDLLTLTFSTAEPCLPQATTQASSCYLYNPSSNRQDWICVFRIVHGQYPDMTVITAQSLLDGLFPNGYRYYGAVDGVTYLAPFELSYRLIPQSDSPDSVYLLELTASHAVELLPPYAEETEEGRIYSLSYIDAAGNGPCCITILLEDTDVLLYNLKDGAADAPSALQTVQSGGAYAGKSH